MYFLACDNNDQNKNCPSTGPFSRADACIICCDDGTWTGTCACKPTLYFNYGIVNYQMVMRKVLNFKYQIN